MDFFVLSKLFWLFVQPIVLIWLALGLACITLLVAGRRLVGLSCAVMFAAAGLVMFSNLGALWLQQLENTFPERDVASLNDAVGIIVLGGGFDGRVTQGRGGFALGESGDRFVEAAALARRFDAMPVIVTGGEASLIGTTEGDAAIAPRFFERLGVETDRLRLEDQSKNTWQNATLTADLIAATGQAKGPWVLITSAFHMRRSVGCFRQAGVDVIAWPVDYRTAGDESFALGRDDPGRALNEFSIALRESIGLAVYSWTGRMAVD